VRILITGVSGWAGEEVASSLLAAGHDVTGFSRHPEDVTVDLPVIRGDAATGSGLDQALRGADVAYYFIHSLEAGNEEGFLVRDKRAAENFAAAVRRAEVPRLVFLGPLASAGELTDHLRSRLEVERIVCAAAPRSLSLRASMVIHPRSPGFRFLVRLVQRLPIIARTRIGERLWQPIDGRDVTACLVAAATWPQVAGQALDVGGPDVVPFVEISAGVAAVLGLEREVVPAPDVEPMEAARELTKLTGDDPSYVGPLLATAAAGNHVASHDGAAMLGVSTRGLQEALEYAVSPSAG
jgi:uncharacterized protein YbjT (DUF2867 family)